MSDVFLQGGAILLLIFVNGFFALSEMALVAARKARLRSAAQSGDRKSRSALLLKERPDQFLSSVQIGITLVGILTGALGGATLAERMEGYFATVPELAPYGRWLALVLVVLPITYLTLILGELVPKRLAIAHPERWARLTAPVMRGVLRIFLPAVHFLSLSTRVVIGLFGMRQSQEPAVTEEDIRSMIQEATAHGVVEKAEQEMLDRIFRLGDRQVSALMTHRSRVVWLDLNEGFEANMRKILKSPYSRFPVARGSLGNIKGVIKAKEFLGLCMERPRNIERHLHRPLFVPETMRALKLLDLFRKQPRMHFAIVLDEFGDIQGVVTLNDLFESIVGDIPSTGEEPEPAAVQRDDGSWLIDGLMPVDEVQALLGVRQPMQDEDMSYNTLAGFILVHGGRIPKIGDHFLWNGFRFEVVDMDGKRIDRVLISKQEDVDEEG